MMMTMKDIDWGLWARVLGVGFIHAFTLGTILVFGLMRDSVNAAVSTPTDITFLSGMQYALFLASGAFSYVLKMGLRPMWRMCLRKNERGPETHEHRLTQWAEMSVSFIGVFLWTFGYGLSLPLSTMTGNYNIYLWMWFSMGGVGAGLLYWNTLGMIRSWFSKEPTLALGWVMTSPRIYVFIFPYIEDVIPAFWVYDWVTVFALVTIVGGSVMLLLVPFLTSKKTKEKNDEDKSSAKIVGTKMTFHTTFALFCFALACFQVAFYVPYIDVPPHVTAATGLGSTASEKSLVVSMIGMGSIAGGVFYTFVAWIWKHQMFWLTASSFGMSMFFILGGLVGTDILAMRAFAFLFGFFSGGCVTLIPIVVDTHWMKFDVNTKHMFYGTALLIGQCFSAPMIGYVVNEYIHSMIFAGSASAVTTLIFMEVTRRGWNKEPSENSRDKVSERGSSSSQRLLAPSGL